VRIREVNTNGIITTVAGDGGAAYTGDGGLATNAELNYPIAVATDGSGDLFIADTDNNVIREVNTNGIIETIAGNVAGGYTGDGGPALNALMSDPEGVAVDASGHICISDTGNMRLRKIGTNGLQVDGIPATEANLFEPSSVAVDCFGDLFISVIGEIYTTNYFSYRICEVTPSGILTTVAGNGASGFLGDGGPPLMAQLYPIGLALDSKGNIFIAGYESDRVREIPNPAAALVLSNLLAGDAGNYDVVISNPYGSVTSSVVALNAVLPPLSAAVITGQGWQLQASGASGSAYVLQMATTLNPPVNWQSIATNTVDANGNCRFTDTNFPTDSAKFYRLSN
jgi:hypothetical protein